MAAVRRASTGSRQRGRDAVRERERVLLADDALAHDRELVAAETSHGVAVAGDRLQARRERAQQLVAAVVPEGVVDDLEVVEVEQQHGDRAALVARARERLLEALR